MLHLNKHKRFGLTPGEYINIYSSADLDPFLVDQMNTLDSMVWLEIYGANPRPEFIMCNPLADACIAHATDYLNSLLPVGVADAFFASKAIGVEPYPECHTEA